MKTGDSNVLWCPGEPEPGGADQLLLGGDGRGRGREHHQSGVRDQRAEAGQVHQAARRHHHRDVHIEYICEWQGLNYLK